MDEEYLGAMYQSDEEVESSAAPEIKLVDRGIMNMPTLSHKLRGLEKTVADQARVIKRLQQAINTLTNNQRSRNSELHDLRTQVDNKIDRRDM